MKHARHSLFIIASVFFFFLFFFFCLVLFFVVVILRAETTRADILRIIKTPRERKLEAYLNFSKWTYTVERGSHWKFYLILNELLNNLVTICGHEWRQMTSWKQVTLLRTLMKSCKYTYHSKNWMVFCTLLHLTVSNLIYAGIPLVLF